MKIDCKACLVMGILPWLSSVLTAQHIPSQGSLPPEPAEYASMIGDDQVVPVAHHVAVRGGKQVFSAGDGSARERSVQRRPTIPNSAGIRQPQRSQPVGVTMELSDEFPLVTSAGHEFPVGTNDAFDLSPGGGCAEIGSCQTGCGTCGPCDVGIRGVDSCCPPVWRHRSGAFGEYLYLRPREAEVVYAVPIDGPIFVQPGNNPIQVGPLGMVDPGYQSGYRVGFGIAISDCSSLTASITRLDSQSSDSISTEPAEVLRSLVAHPSSTSAATDWLNASARYDVDFQFVDLDFRALWRGGDNYAINYNVGARYGKLEQSFTSLFSANGTEVVNSNIDFEGGGIKLGLDLERYGCAQKLFVYSRANASFLAGQFDAAYFQGQSFDPTVADTGWDAGRIVTVLDAEAGVGWRSQSGRWKFSTGYLVSAWLNTVKANQFIKSVQQNEYLNLADDNLTFDGWVVRGEFNF
ncbi:MAG: Lpg1974 family pore-forming outer membrane protein [Planctomycetota bacterium]|nr:Lpg1974 family pore-forming outer membrane protein [Planctomycetota bacterium]